MNNRNRNGKLGANSKERKESYVEKVSKHENL